MLQVADPDLQIRRRGGGGLEVVFKNCSWPFGPHFGPKIKGGPLGPSPGSATAIREMFNPLVTTPPVYRYM